MLRSIQVVNHFAVSDVLLFILMNGAFDYLIYLASLS